MHSIVIVDDESIIRRGLKNTIDTYGKDEFYVAGDAANGEDGFRLIEKVRPDIVITDVKMPRLNGIDMIRRCREKNIRIRTVFISGFNEFAFIKDALELKAETYCLKPVSHKELMEKLFEAGRQINERRQMEAQLKAGRPLIMQAFLLKLLTNQWQESEEEVLEIARSHKINFEEGNFASIVFQLDQYFQWEVTGKAMERELCKFAMENIAQEVFEEKYRVAAYEAVNDEFDLIVNSKNLQKAELAQMGSAICRQVKSITGATVTVGIGRIYHDIRSVAQSYHEAIEAVSFKYVMGRNRVIHVDDVAGGMRRQTPGEPVKLFPVEKLKHSVLVQIKIGNTQVAKETLAALKAEMSGKGPTMEEIRLNVMDILLMIIREICVDDTEAVTKFQLMLYQCLRKVCLLETIDDIFDVFESPVEEICGWIRERKKKQGRLIIRQAMDFLKRNYQNENLTLQDVADEVHMSVPYLSAMFKKESGSNFTECLTGIRMKKAEELLSSSADNIYEVSRMVGYANAKYFSACFKKYTGYSPREYKKG